MAKVYSRFLSLTSGLSLEEVQVNAGSEVELLTIMVPHEDSEELTVILDKRLTSAAFISDRPLLPNVTLESGVDFDIDQSDSETFKITFSKPLAEFGFPYRETPDGVEYAIWATDCTLDEGLIYSQYAKTIRVAPDVSTNIYKDYIKGLYFLFTQGPNLSYMEQGINLALGVPVSRSNEVVFLRTFDPQQGTWVVVTNRNSYVLPYGIEPRVERGDVLTPGEAIANIVEIQDFVSDGAWWLDIYLPESIFPTAAAGGLGESGQIAALGSPAYELMATYLKTHTFLVKVLLSPGSATGNFDTLRSIISNVKPSYTLGIFTWQIELPPEDILIDDELGFTVQPTVIKDDFIGLPGYMDRSQLSEYPSGEPKTTRGTNRWFIKGNYSPDHRNIYNQAVPRVIVPVHIAESDYLGTIGPVVDSTKVSITSRYNTFVSDGVSSMYYLEFTPLSKHNLHIYVNGIYQQKSAFYTYEHLVALNTTPSAGSRVDVVYLSSSNLNTKTFNISGDDLSTSFSLPFYFPDETYVIVYENGVAINHNKYSINANTITFDVPLVSGTDNIDIVVFTAPAIDTPIIYVFSGDDITVDFDIGVTDLVGVNTQVFVNGVYQEKSKYVVDSGVLTFPTAPVSGINNIEVISTQAMANQAGLLSAQKDGFSGNGSTTSFTLPYTPAGRVFLQVFINGIRQSSDSFILTGSGVNIIQFSEAPPAGTDNIEVVYLVGDRVTANDVLFTGDGVTTLFTTPFTIQSPLGVSVYVDGVYQLQSTYTLGTTSITFSQAPPTSVPNNILLVALHSDFAMPNVATFTTDGIQTVFDTGITEVAGKYVDVYFNGIYQHKDSYIYSSGIVSLLGTPPAMADSLQVITSNYSGETPPNLYATPLYNLKESEVRTKLVAAGITVPSVLPNRFALYDYVKDPTLDSRDGVTPVVAQGETYYSPVSDIYLENLLSIDSNGQTPEVNRSYYFKNINTGIMMFQQCGEGLDLWTVFAVGDTYKELAFPVPEEDELSIYLVEA